MATFLIGYDICCPKRLVRVHRKMCHYAMPFQYSIFLLEGSEIDVQHCLDAVLPLIHPHEDDVRCYKLPVRGIQFRIGRPVLPTGIIWTGLPVSWNVSAV